MKPEVKRTMNSGRKPIEFTVEKNRIIARAYARGLSRADVSRAIFVSEYLLVIWEKKEENQLLVAEAKLKWDQVVARYMEEDF